MSKIKRLTDKQLEEAAFAKGLNKRAKKQEGLVWRNKPTQQQRKDLLAPSKRPKPGKKAAKYYRWKAKRITGSIGPASAVRRMVVCSITGEIIPAETST